eukprot:1763-Heterococcus_DN1.PRE.2
MAALASAADAQLQKDLTEDEVADYKEAFDNFDKDHSGEIDENELATVLRSLGYAPTDKQLKDMMARVDLDGNGKRPPHAVKSTFKRSSSQLTCLCCTTVLLSHTNSEFVAMMKSVELTTDFDMEIREAFKRYKQRANLHTISFTLAAAVLPCAIDAAELSKVMRGLGANLSTALFSSKYAFKKLSDALPCHACCADYHFVRIVVRDARVITVTQKWTYLSRKLIPIQMAL